MGKLGKRTFSILNLSLLLGFLTVGDLRAQSLTRWESTWTDPPPPLMRAPSFDATLSAGLLQMPSPPQGRKSATTAGFLSGVCFLLPVCGLGSFYAGDAAHGWRHLGIGVASLGTLVAAFAAGNCSFVTCEPEGAGVAVAIGAGLAYTANGIWSIVVAGEDAHAHNRRLEQPRVAFVPAIEFLPVPPALRPTVGLRVVSVTF
jgi:hypothetical protein